MKCVTSYRCAGIILCALMGAGLSWTAQGATMTLSETSRGGAFPVTPPSGYGWYIFANHLHCNIEPDDGSISLKAVIQNAGTHKANYCSITSHRTMNACSDGDFQPWNGCIPTCGEEWGGGEHAGLLNMDGGDPMVGWTAQDMIASVIPRGGFVIANHPMGPPVGNGAIWDDPLWPGMDGVEVWNTVWIGTPNGLARDWWEYHLVNGRRAFCIGGSDVHYPLLNPCMPCNAVLAANNDADSVLHAVRNGCMCILTDENAGKCVMWGDMDNDGTFETLMGGDARIDEPRTIKLRAEVYDREGDKLSLYTAAGKLGEYEVGAGNPWAIEFSAEAGPDTRDYFRGEVAATLSMHSISNPIYINTMPYLRDLSPVRARGEGGTVVTIHGTNFVDEVYSAIVSPDTPGPPWPAVSCPITVTFGGIAAANVVKTAFNEITVEAPANPVDGPVDVVVNSVNGPATLEEAFIYDSTPPELILNGDTMMFVECQQPFSDPGVSANDAIEGDLSEAVVVGGGAVDTTTPGTYVITYDVSDSLGNTAEQKARTIIVFDNAPPVISLFGSTEIHLECPQPYTEPGWNAFDECDKEITGSVIVGGQVDTTVAGVYYLTYDVQDREGNRAIQQTRTVIVEDTSAPVIALQGGNPLMVPCNTAYLEPGYTASDTCDGTLTGNVIADSSGVDMDAAGTYAVLYSVMDAAGNPFSISRTVEVTGPCENQEGEGSLEGSEEGEAVVLCEGYSGVCGHRICSEDTPKAILPMETTTSTLYVPVSETIADVNVTLEIEHPRTEDLVAFLKAPNDTQVLLFSYPVHGGVNMTGTVLDDEASVGIGGGAAPFTGTFRPQSHLFIFDTLGMQGAWELSITDGGISGTGALLSWSLIFNPCPDGEGEGQSEGEGELEGQTEGQQEGEGVVEGQAEGAGPEGEPEGSAPGYHTADQNNDWTINLSELLRVIQFFNSGGLHCQSGTEDGYAPGASGDTSCAAHASDYTPNDWRIGLSELLRLIQMFNSGGYHACAGGEDGYCPGLG